MKTILKKLTLIFLLSSFLGLSVVMGQENARLYDPRDFDGTGGAASFEPGMDRQGRYVRAWIAHQSVARKVVRIRYALANNLYDIAFPDIPSGSPYGKGDWVEEWFTIYPDGVHTRHCRVLL